MPRVGRDSGWFKSSRSGAGSDQCIEVRIIEGDTVGVRDSKKRDAGALWVTPAAWHSFVASARTKYSTDE